MIILSCQGGSCEINCPWSVQTSGSLVWPMETAVNGICFPWEPF